MNDTAIVKESAIEPGATFHGKVVVKWRVTDNRTHTFGFGGQSFHTTKVLFEDGTFEYVYKVRG